MKPESSSRLIYVYAHWKGMSKPLLMGQLRAEMARGKEIFSFSYEREWLESRASQILDPELLFYPGTWYADSEKQNFGLFLDSSPDRWGRMLMTRREALLARNEKRPERTLRESDYLLGVYDNHRMGALRFKEQADGPFLNDNAEYATPPWTSVRELEQISLLLEQEDVYDNPDYDKWLTMLVNPGSSLGGARPKASVVDSDGALWIAKFPARADRKDNGGWEMVANELARAAGLNVAQAVARKFSGNHHTFLTKRFDRTVKNERLHYASALTMLGYRDGDDHTAGASYLDIADFLTRHGANIKGDLKELWSRIAFSILISNSDDHLRNHGFILTEQGWILSPAFDINPDETGRGLSLNINLDDNSLSIELALEVAEHFRLTRAEAGMIVERLKRSVSKWRRVAERYKLSRHEQEMMAGVFERF